MENARSFLTQELFHLSEKFLDIYIKYDHNEMFNDHVVIIKPSSLYDSKEYIEAELDITVRFYELFPNQSICFIEQNDSLVLDNVVIEILPACEVQENFEDYLIDNEPYEFFVNSGLTNSFNENYALAA